MKTATGFFSLMTIMLIISLTGNANAQGRGQQRDVIVDRSGDHDWRDHHKDRHDHDHRWKKHHAYEKSVRHRHRDHDRHFAHDHSNHCTHARIVKRYHERPRYVYYRDYDVYYDSYQSVYIMWSGRSWEVSATVPVVLRRVDRQRAVRMVVDYYDDHFTSYLASGRPAYKRIYTGS